MSLKHSDIAEIIKLIDQSALDEVSIEVGDVKIEVRRRGATGLASQPAVAPTPSPAPVAAPAPAPASPATTSAAAEESVLASTTRSDGAAGLIEVRSPMVGTFYRRPAPESPAYADVGTVVSAGDPLCLVEVMKLFTTLHAEVAGKVVEICVGDADLVEHDQVLFRLEPT